MTNPQSHSAHYFCHLHEHSIYSALKVQESRIITLRNYKNTNCIYLYSKICQNKVVNHRLDVRDLNSEVGSGVPEGSPSI